MIENRWQDIADEIPRDSITDEEVKSYALRHMLRRMSDQEHDQKAASRFKGKTEDEISELIKDDIMNGVEP